MTESSPLVMRYVRWLSRWAGTVLLASAALALLATLSLLRLEFDVGLVSMLPKGSKRFADYERFVERFGTQDLVVVLVRAPDRVTARRFAAVFADTLADQPEIVQVRAGVDRDAFLEALAEGGLVRHLPLDRHPAIAERLQPANVDRAVVAMKRVLATPGTPGLGRVLVADPLGFSAVLGESLAASRPDRALDPGADGLASADGRRVLLLVRPTHSGYDLEAVERLAGAFEAAEGAARAARPGLSDVSVGYAGAFAHAREDSAMLHRDISLYVVMALIGVLAVFYLGYRDLRILPFVTYHLMVTTLVALALGVMLLDRLNLISLAFAAIFYGLGIDAAIHFYTRFLEERALASDAPEALARTVVALLPPTVLAALTTAFAFAMIGFSSLRGVAQLGQLTATGLLLNVPATFFVMAALLLWFERRGTLAAACSPTRASLLATVAAFVAQRRRASLVVLAGVLALSILGARNAYIDTDLFHLRPAESRARAVEEEIQREFGFTDPHGSVLVETDRPDNSDATDAVLRTVERVTQQLRLEEQGGQIRSVTSPSPLLPSRATQEARIRSWVRLDREAAVDRLEAALDREGFRREMFVETIDALRRIPAPVDAIERPLPGLEVLLERQVKRDDSGLSVLVSFSPTDTSTFEDVAARLERETDVPRGVSMLVTGRPLMEAELGRTARGELAAFVALVLVFTATLITLRERPLTSALAILVVPVGSVLLLVGLVGAWGIPLTPVSLVVLPLTVGIGLDDCLYLIERYRETGDAAEAVARGGRALSITTATTMTGFGALALSRYPALSGLGSLAVMSLALCFVVTIIVLPIVLSPAWLRGGRP